MAEKKRNWDEWIDAATNVIGRSATGAALGALGAKAVKKIQTDARNEARAMSYPDRPTTYSKTRKEREEQIDRAIKAGTYGKVAPKQKSGSVGRESAETARDNRRRLAEW